MIPGKMNSREVKRMMAQMGIKSTEMSDVKTVIMKGATKDYMITDAQVTMIEAQGQKTFQIMGTFKEVAKSDEETKAEAAPAYSEEDVKLVMEQASVSREKALEALKNADGEPAKAIMDLLPK
jgi:nascent polypeptide-associated complex subunit alpha